MAALAAFAALAALLRPAAGSPSVAPEIEVKLAASAIPAWVSPDGRSAAHWAAVQNFYK